MTKRQLGPREMGAYLTPEVIVERVRAWFPMTEVGEPRRGVSEALDAKNWLLVRVVGPRLAAEALEQLRGAVPFTIGDQYGGPSLHCFAAPARGGRGC
jgi:hypothetical protein